MFEYEQICAIYPQMRFDVRLNSMTLIEPAPTARDRVDLGQPLLTAANIAELLGIPRSSIYDYARRKHDPLPSVEIGRHRRFIRRDVEGWLAEHRMG